MIAAAALLTIAVIVFTLYVRTSDLPAPEAVSPTRHLEERKAAIYDNLRDLQFEFRLGKLSEADYEQTKASLQKELAQVAAEIDRLSGNAAPLKPAPKLLPNTCPHCGAKFDRPMRFCGECGKPMTGDAA
jgi:NADH pyrophosphatase NudC (nudix superfamily)